MGSESAKACLTCGRNLPLPAFTRNAHQPGGRRSHCKSCESSKRHPAPVKGGAAGYERLVLIGGRTFLYREKAPFVPSGMSTLGALEYDPAMDRVRCHECGEWFKAIGSHIGKAHGISAREYKIRHGLRLKAALFCESTRGKFVQRPQRLTEHARALAASNRLSVQGRAYNTMEGKNSRGTCPAQLLDKIKKIAQEIGRTPSVAELRKRGISDTSVINTLGAKGMPDVMRLAGLMPRLPDGYSDEGLVEMLRSRAEANGRVPTVSDCKRGFLPSIGTFRKHFGSWANAVKKAGLIPELATQSAATGWKWSAQQ